MAVLPDEARAELAAEENRRLSDERDPNTLTRAELRAAFNALDDFLHNNAAAINNAFPTAARNALTPKQKARIVMLVAAQRARIL